MYGDEEKEGFDDEKESMHGMHIEGEDEEENADDFGAEEDDAL